MAALFVYVIRDVATVSVILLAVLIAMFVSYAFLLAKYYLLIHESPLTDALFLLVSKSDEVTTT